MTPPPTQPLDEDGTVGMSQPTAQTLGAPLPGHKPWYEAEIQMAGVDPEGWVLNERTGRAQAGCTCGQRIEWDDQTEVMVALAATCFAPPPSPPQPLDKDGR